MALSTFLRGSVSGGGGGGGGGPGLQDNTGVVQVYDSAAAMGTLPNGRSFAPLTKSSSSAIITSMQVGHAGTYQVVASYSMAAAAAGDVDFLVTTSVEDAEGGDDDPALSAGASTVTDTPGTDTDAHDVTLASVSASAGDTIHVKVDRDGASDTHANDAQVLGLRIVRSS